MSDQTNQRIDVYLLCNAKYHDTNFSRLELLKLLAEHEDVWTRVGDSYRDIDAINRSRLLITYTCDLSPTVEEQVGLKRFLQSGGRWLALHGTNALIEFTDSGKVDTPDSAPELMRMLGSRFVGESVRSRGAPFPDSESGGKVSGASQRQMKSPGGLSFANTFPEVDNYHLDQIPADHRGSALLTVRGTPAAPG